MKLLSKSFKSEGSIPAASTNKLLIGKGLPTPPTASNRPKPCPLWHDLGTVLLPVTSWLGERA